MDSLTPEAGSIDRNCCLAVELLRLAPSVRLVGCLVQGDSTYAESGVKKGVEPRELAQSDVLIRLRLLENLRCASLKNNRYRG